METSAEIQLVTDRSTVHLDVRQLAIYHRLYIGIMYFLIRISKCWEQSTGGVRLSHLSSTSSLTSRKRKKGKKSNVFDLLYNFFFFFFSVVHWNFCIKKNERRRKRRASVNIHISLSLSLHIYNSKKKRYVVYFSASSGCKKHAHVLS